MRIQFVKFDPNGNITILVESRVPREAHAALAARLMAEIGGEQAGYIEPSGAARARLQMMGGEFCGNASMALAAHLAEADGLAEGAEAEYALEVSGADGLVRCRVRREGEAFRGRVQMPLPESVGEAAMPLGAAIPAGAVLPLVRLPGIAHLIVPEGMMSDREAELRAPELCRELGAEAMGLMVASGDFSRMRPLVYVASTNSLVWERGCGSGTAAMGAYLAARLGHDVSLEIAQPGGTIGVRASWNGRAVDEIEISGSVRVERQGEIEIELP